MVPPAPRECNQPTRSVLYRKQSAHRNQPTRSVLYRKQSAHRNQLAAPVQDRKQAMVGKHFLFHEVIPKAESKQSVIDVHFCQFARLSNAIKADKLPPAVELQARRLVHGNASSGKKSWKSIFRACAGASTCLVHSELGLGFSKNLASRNTHTKCATYKMFDTTLTKSQSHAGSS